MNFWSVFTFKSVGFLTPPLQFSLVVILFGLAVFTQYREFKRTGKTYGSYPFRWSTFFSSIYEEAIFRGLILFGLLLILSPIASIVFSSLLFGLWHIKNRRWHSNAELYNQILYTGLVFGPLVATLTLATGTIWPAIIVHYCANLLSDTLRKKRL